MKEGVAAFDFDGTIASGDSVVPFVSHVIGRRATLSALWQLVPLARSRNRDLLKQRFVELTLKGKSEAELREAGEHFARHLHINKVRPTMTERIDWHRERGHRLVIVSASFDLYLEPLRRMLGFDDLLCTQLAYADGVATGELAGNNVRAGTKAVLLNELLGDTSVDLWAYGNSSGDVPMLSRADHAFWVTRSGEIRAWSETRRKVIDLRTRSDSPNIT